MVKKWIFVDVGYSKRDRTRDEYIRNKVGVVLVEDKMREARLRWFRHGDVDAQMCGGVREWLWMV